MSFVRFVEPFVSSESQGLEGVNRPLQLWIAPLLAGASIVAFSVMQPPQSIWIVFGGSTAILLTCWKPWLGFALVVCAEALITEDQLLRTEKLADTIYYHHLPLIGCNIFEAGLALCVGATLVRNRWRPVLSRLDVPVLFFGAVAILGYVLGGLNSGDWSRLYEIRRIFHFLIAYFLTVNLIDSPAKLRGFFCLYLLAVGLKGIQGVYLYSIGEGLMVKWKLRAIFTGWGEGLNFTVFLLAVAAFWFRRIRMPAQWMWRLMAFPVAFSFLMTYKRAFYLGLAAGLCVLFLVFDAKARRRMIAYGSAVAIAGITLLAVTGKLPNVATRIASIFEPKKESSANYRLIEWQNALISIRMHPWWGIGLGGVLAMVIFLPRTNLLGIHNTYLWSAVKIGVPGLLAVLWLIFSVLGLVFRDLRTAEGERRAIAEILLASLAAFCTAAMFAPMFHQTQTSLWFGVFAGIVSIFGEPKCRDRLASPPFMPVSRAGTTHSKSTGLDILETD